MMWNLKSTHTKWKREREEQTKSFLIFCILQLGRKHLKALRQGCVKFSEENISFVISVELNEKI